MPPVTSLTHSSLKKNNNHLIKSDFLIIPVLNVEEQHHTAVFISAGQDPWVTGLNGAADSLWGQVFKEFRVIPSEAHITFKTIKLIVTSQGEKHSSGIKCTNKNSLAKLFTLHEFIGPVYFIFPSTDEPHQHTVGVVPKSVLYTFSKAVSRIRLLFDNTSELLYS